MNRRNKAKIIKLNDFKRQKLFEVIIDSFDKINFKESFSSPDFFVDFLKGVIGDLRKRR